MPIDTLILIVVVAFLAWGALLCLQCVIRTGGVGIQSRDWHAE